MAGRSSSPPVTRRPPVRPSTPMSGRTLPTQWTLTPTPWHPFLARPGSAVPRASGPVAGAEPRGSRGWSSRRVSPCSLSSARARAPTSSHICSGFCSAASWAWRLRPRCGDRCARSCSGRSPSPPSRWWSARGYALSPETGAMARVSPTFGRTSPTFVRTSTPEFWEDVYARGGDGWELGRPAPPLVDVLDTMPPPRGRVAVPGCGRGHDARLLAARGYDVTGFDFAPAALSQARALAAREGVAATFDGRDVFTLGRELPNAFDGVWEYTCFCAIA